MKRFFPLVVLCALMSSCGPDLVTLAIDNPTDSYIEVSVDSLAVEVPPREVAWVEMGRGNHDIITSDTTATFNFVADVYMINPTMSEYLMYEEAYGSSAFGNLAMGGTIPKKTVSFYGMEVEGRYDVIRDLISTVRWDYGPREELPEMIEMDASETVAYMVKLADFNEVFSEAME